MAMREAGGPKGGRKGEEQEGPAAGGEAEGSDRFLDRELSEIAFVARVLELAEDDREPLLERLNYLKISAGLLDEYYKIRVAALRRSEDKADVLARADAASNALMLRQQDCWQALEAALATHGIALLDKEEAGSKAEERLVRWFDSDVLPHLDPIVVGSGEPLPFLPDNEMFVVTRLQGADGPSHGLVPLPDALPRFVSLDSAPGHFMSMEAVVMRFSDRLFPVHRVEETALARILREGALHHHDEIVDILADVEEAVEERKHAPVIRLKMSGGASNPLARFVAHGCGLIDDGEWQGRDVDGDIVASEFVAIDGLLGKADTGALADLIKGAGIDLSGLQYDPPLQVPDPILKGRRSLFPSLREAPRLLHFPYDDFLWIERLLDEAAEDEKVVSIKQTLYRSGKNSPVIDALKRAAQNGKSVTVVMELEARDDEEANIALARELEAEGTQVVFGLADRKVHAKIFQICRREEGGLQSYVNFATGNYHSTNARYYTDLSLLTTDGPLVRDAVRIFNYLTSTVLSGKCEKISLAPFDMRETLLERISKERDLAKAGEPAAIWAKLNRLTDKTMIEALYEASGAGVDIRLIVRGPCLLRPGVPGLSETIRVRSLVGRLLEHSRLICFGAGHDMPSDEAAVYLTSADWMPHKLDDRVEVLVPIGETALRRQIMAHVFEPCWRDTCNSWDLEGDGTYVRHSGGEEYAVQTALFGLSGG